ncbi:hypothetical protein AB6A40_002694 [Gnathostoma spinigerum]|uniref:CID domain-containing protein n=1 Tax=Gnathostoma spinigerum TaxID=75299 RepID=A0ABD6E8H6_9BILA
MVLSDDVIVRRLRALDQTSESIQTTSMWVMHHRDSVNEVVSCWMNVFKTAEEPLQVALFFLANDVCQKAKKKSDSYMPLLNAFAPKWITAIAFSRGSPVVTKAVNRILDIFEERMIYSKSQLADMRSAQGEAGDGDDSSILDFDSTMLIRDIESYRKGDIIMERARDILNRSDFSFEGKIKCRIKDRRDGEKFIAEIDASYKKLADFRDALTKHRNKGHNLLELTEQGRRFYSFQLRDATVVEDAYQKFGAGIDSVRNEVEEMLRTGVFPGASPPRDAPSPTANDDPFEAGVEKAIERMRHPRENTDVTDMDVEKEDEHIVSDTISVHTNQSFAGSTETLLRIMSEVRHEEPKKGLTPSASDPRLQSQLNASTSATSSLSSNAQSTMMTSPPAPPAASPAQIPVASSAWIPPSPGLVIPPQYTMPPPAFMNCPPTASSPMMVSTSAQPSLYPTVQNNPPALTSPIGPGVPLPMSSPPPANLRYRHPNSSSQPPSSGVMSSSPHRTYGAGPPPPRMPLLLPPPNVGGGPIGLNVPPPFTGIPPPPFQMNPPPFAPVANPQVSGGLPVAATGNQPASSFPAATASNTTCSDKSGERIPSTSTACFSQLSPAVTSSSANSSHGMTTISPSTSASMTCDDKGHPTVVSGSRSDSHASSIGSQRRGLPDYSSSRISGIRRSSDYDQRRELESNGTYSRLPDTIDFENRRPSHRRDHRGSDGDYAANCTTRIPSRYESPYRHDHDFDRNRSRR